MNSALKGSLSCIFFDKNNELILLSLKFVPDVQLTIIQYWFRYYGAWHRLSDKPLSKPMMTNFTDAYMCHSVSMSLKLFMHCHVSQWKWWMCIISALYLNFLLLRLSIGVYYILRICGLPSLFSLLLCFLWLLLQTVDVAACCSHCRLFSLAYLILFTARKNTLGNWCIICVHF